MENDTFTDDNRIIKEKPICKEGIITDMHCHSSMKPYNNILQGVIHNNNPKSKTSIWHYDPPSKRDKKRNRRWGIARFSQTNFTAWQRAR